jgi:phage repressor protein C with HTH and peptisase S24 domain
VKKPEEILKEKREAKGLTQTEMADKLGIGLRMYQKIEDGQFPKYKKNQVRQIDEILGTQLYDLIYEQDVPPVSTDSYIDRRRNLKNDESPYLVPYVDIPAQAGYRKAYSNIDYILTLKKYPILPDVDPTGLTWRYFQIAGDSMEPVLSDKDTVLASLVHPEDWMNITNYYTHVVVTHTDLLIKDVYKKSPEEWILLSQNSAYEPRVIQIRDVRQLWVVRRHVKNRIQKNTMYDMDEILKNLK